LGRKRPGTLFEQSSRRAANDGAVSGEIPSATRLVQPHSLRQRAQNQVSSVGRDFIVSQTRAGGVRTPTAVRPSPESCPSILSSVQSATRDEQCSVRLLRYVPVRPRRRFGGKLCAAILSSDYLEQCGMRFLRWWPSIPFRRVSRVRISQGQKGLSSSSLRNVKRASIGARFACPPGCNAPVTSFRAPFRRVP